jgi:hypothetical protein
MSTILSKSQMAQAVVGFSLVVGFVFVEVEDVVVAAGAEAFGVDLHFSFASFAG